MWEGPVVTMDIKRRDVRMETLTNIRDACVKYKATVRALSFLAYLPLSGRYMPEAGA